MVAKFSIMMNFWILNSPVGNHNTQGTVKWNRQYNIKEQKLDQSFSNTMVYCRLSSSVIILLFAKTFTYSLVFTKIFT